MNEKQFWRFCVDCGLVTRTFNRKAVSTVWARALSGVRQVHTFTHMLRTTTLLSNLPCPRGADASPDITN